MRTEDGPTGAPRLIVPRTREAGGEKTHADRFWALALACAAAAGMAGPFAGESDGTQSAVVQTGYGVDHETGRGGLPVIDEERGMVISPLAEGLSHYG